MALDPRDRELARYLAWASRQAFTWGDWDCACGLLARWVERRTGADLAAAWRGRYRTAVGCARLLRREGGLVAVLSRQAAEAGLAPSAKPRPGDAGAVLMRTHDGDAPTGALFTRLGWAALAPAGLLVTPATHVFAVWEV